MQAAHRVAKNTAILYGRMAITVSISLYATRLILSALGAADFGLFNVVGGVIAMLGFLNASMAAATQRFMSFAQGEGDLEKVKRIFNMSTILHIGIAIVMVVVLEIVGYFFFHGVLKISVGRIGVARLIYQFMVVSTFFTIISVPYEAVITSHENMLLYAMLGIVESLLKLGIAFYITYSTYDHLVMYGLLMVLLSLLLLMIRRIYCNRQYHECKINFKKYHDKILLKELSGFAGWSFLGTGSSMLANYGQGIIINIFFGTMVNAAQGIANQVSGQLGIFSATLIKALNPAIDKSEGAGNRKLMLQATIMGSKMCFFLMMLLHIPFIIEMPFVLKLWLTNVPDYAIVFCRLLLIRSLIEQFFIPLVSSIAAEGNIKNFQISSSLLTLFPLFISFILFNNNYPPYYLYIVFIIYSILASLIILYYSKQNCQLSISFFFTNVICRCIISFIIVFLIAIIPCYIIKSGILQFSEVFLFHCISFLFVVYFIGFSKYERGKISQLLNPLFQKFLFINDILNNNKIK